MSLLAITGWSALSAAGNGVRSMAEVLDGRPLDPASAARLYDEELPPAGGLALTEFDGKSLLGRKGTSFLDRGTMLAVVACVQALQDGGIAVDASNRERIGVLLGTTAGSLRSTCDYSAETLTADKPYLVNPVLFPNTVMNRAAGQAAIWAGLQGVNATVAGGRLAFLTTLRYATSIVLNRHADALLIGAFEELTPHRAWYTHHTYDRRTPAGEAAVVYFVEPVSRAVAAGRRAEAELLAVSIGFAADGSNRDALAACVRRAVERAGLQPVMIGAVATGERDTDDESERAAIFDALGQLPRDCHQPTSLLGDCQSATGALALAGLLARPGRHDGSDRHILLTGQTADGSVGAAVLRRCAGVGSGSE